MNNNNSSNTLLKCIALASCILIVKSLFSIGSTSIKISENEVIEEQVFSKQYKISKENFNEESRAERNYKVINQRTKFKFSKDSLKNFRNNDLRRVESRKDEDVNVAQAPEPLDNRDSETEDFETKKNDDSNTASVDEDGNEITPKTDENGNLIAENNDEEGDDSEEDENGLKKNKKKNEKVAVEESIDELEPEEPFNRFNDIESKDLALTTPTRVEEAVSFMTSEPLTVSDKKTPLSQNPQNSSNNNNEESEADNDEEASSDEVANDSLVIPFDVDQTTFTVIETLIQRGDFGSIDSMLENNSTERKTTYYTLVEYSKNQADSNSEINQLLQKHFFNIDSADLLSQHLVDPNVGNESKRVSYSFLLQLVTSWPTENAEQFSSIFVNGVSPRLTGPTDGEALSPDQELYLILNESIINKFNEINLLSA